MMFANESTDVAACVAEAAPPDMRASCASAVIFLRFSPRSPSKKPADAATFAICLERSEISTAPSWPKAAIERITSLTALAFSSGVLNSAPTSPKALPTLPAAANMSSSLVVVAPAKAASPSSPALPVARSPVSFWYCAKPSITPVGSSLYFAPTAIAVDSSPATDSRGPPSLYAAFDRAIAVLLRCMPRASPP